jgi:hypothetical protein
MATDVKRRYSPFAARVSTERVPTKVVSHWRPMSEFGPGITPSPSLQLAIAQQITAMTEETSMDLQDKVMAAQVGVSPES